MTGFRVPWLRWCADRLRNRAGRHQRRAFDEAIASGTCLARADALDARADRLGAPPAPDTGAPEATDRAGAPSPQS